MNPLMAYYKGMPLAGPRGPAGPDGNPIGTIISYMGMTAPKDYLVCDGAQYSISDYPDLAQFFQQQFAQKNYFGGDGTATFAVPDMRNLFLRGYHGEAEEQLSGEVGERQEATNHPYFLGKASLWRNQARGDYSPINPDTVIHSGSSWRYDAGSDSQSEETAIGYTSRPVNMAVLYCIKAVESTGGGNSAGEVYSTEETRIGTWIDGKPLYRKVIDLTLPSAASGASSYSGYTLPAEINPVNYYGMCIATNGHKMPLYGGNYTYAVINPANQIYVAAFQGDYASALLCLTVEYTKTTD